MRGKKKEKPAAVAVASKRGILFSSGVSYITITVGV